MISQSQLFLYLHLITHHTEAFDLSLSTHFISGYKISMQWKSEIAVRLWCIIKCAVCHTSKYINNMEKVLYFAEILQGGHIWGYRWCFMQHIQRVFFVLRVLTLTIWFKLSTVVFHFYFIHNITISISFTKSKLVS